jgi:hypothetical protein
MDPVVFMVKQLADALLARLAERGLFRPQWSEEILVELDRDLRERGVEGASVTASSRRSKEPFPTQWWLAFGG